MVTLLDGSPRTLPNRSTRHNWQRLRSANVMKLILPLMKANLRRISGRRVCRKCGAPYHIDTMKPKKDGVCDACVVNYINAKMIIKTIS